VTGCRATVGETTVITGEHDAGTHRCVRRGSIFGRGKWGSVAECPSRGGTRQFPLPPSGDIAQMPGNPFLAKSLAAEGTPNAGGDLGVLTTATARSMHPLPWSEGIQGDAYLHIATRAIEHLPKVRRDRCCIPLGVAASETRGVSTITRTGSLVPGPQPLINVGPQLLAARTGHAGIEDERHLLA
jgi:hypothetical protein